MQYGRMKYTFREIEAKWQRFWANNRTFRASDHTGGPKYYVLDMFPYPSGAGLHVGHPLGYIASDIYARYKRHKGFNVLHPMGYDSFGLPAEQYAIQTGQHPAVTTEANINRYREQMDQLGFSFDWSREVRTSDPRYYKWTQWVFIQLFNSWYNLDTEKAEPISALTERFEQGGNEGIQAACDEDTPGFSAAEWKTYDARKKQEILLKYRLTYLADIEVNWCQALGTVLANDEIVNGVSERGGHPVERKKMTQWSMRISAYAQRLLDGLQDIDWPQPLKDAQTNWIGRSEGALVRFRVLTDLPLTPSKGGGRPGYFTSDSKIYKTLLERAKEMRKKPTKAEAALWEGLRNRRLDEKFRRQHPIGSYIADFVCLRKKLVIEVDGDIHKFQGDLDAERQSFLERDHGFTVLRFSNEEVLEDMDSVIHRIKDELNSLSFGEGWGEVNKEAEEMHISVFTTRPDTIFGVSFMTLAPEHELVSKITTTEQKEAVDAYVKATARRSERERMADVKSVSGVFTGAYAEHPFTGAPIPIWIGDYVLAGYGTGAVMSVPCGDQRDHDFATHFDLPIPNIFKGIDVSEEAFSAKEGSVLTNSDFLDGLGYKEAVQKVVQALEEMGQGAGRVNYRLRDAVFSRQRYWGEPFPVYYQDGMPQMLPEECLPLELPEVEKYLPTPTGDPPLGNAEVWAWDTKSQTVVPNERIDQESVFPLELNTMPGWAGSSQYFNRYMDPHNDQEIFAQEAVNYWQDVDLYIGGMEHATGHLLYSRFWQHFMYDLGRVPKKEFARKLINQGMILGESAFLYVVSLKFTNGDDTFLYYQVIVSKEVFDSLESKEGELGALPSPLQTHFEQLANRHLEGNKDFADYTISYVAFKTTNIDVQFVDVQDRVDISKLMKDNRMDFLQHADYFDGKELIGNSEISRETVIKVSREVEKMSKSRYNVVNPDDICREYGADSLRMYEMFLGPLEQAKPWNTAGLSGVHGFLKKLWRLYHSGPEGEFKIDEEKAKPEALKVLHKTIKKVEEDIAAFSFNTTVSTFMICVNELTALKCHSREVLQPLAVLISPYAPHLAEELWERLGHSPSIARVPFPVCDEKYLVEEEKEYPVSFNGKLRFTLSLSLDLDREAIEKAVMADERTIRYLEGKEPRKVIVVPGKIVNIVL